MTIRLRRWCRGGSGEGAPPSGQIIIMFALFLTAMVGMLGLAIDVGYAYSQRRTVQNAADAGAHAGARAVSKWSATNRISALPEVQAFALATANKLGSATQTITACNYVNDAGTIVGDCASEVPSTATGVRVTVREEHPTFFIQAVPGAPNTVTTQATATAHVQILTRQPTDGPFLVCGINTQLATGGTKSILVRDGTTWKVDPSAVGQTFEIHGPRIATCDAQSERFKGLADTVKNRALTIPEDFWYTEGTAAGTIQVDVVGASGCKAGQEVVDCVTFLPVGVNVPKETDNDRRIWTVAMLPFYVTAPKANEHHGRLLPDYIVLGPGQSGWSQGFAGSIVIRLT